MRFTEGEAKSPRKNGESQSRPRRAVRARRAVTIGAVWPALPAMRHTDSATSLFRRPLVHWLVLPYAIGCFSASFLISRNSWRMSLYVRTHAIVDFRLCQSRYYDGRRP
jgi:hypothetical protein